MITRELYRFKWVYHEGTVTLIDKKKGIQFSLPIVYLDSLMRAGITFKNHHRIEQIKKQQDRIKAIREQAAAKRKRELLKKGVIPGQLDIKGKEVK